MCQARAVLAWFLALAVGCGSGELQLTFASDCAAIPAGRSRDLCWRDQISVLPPQQADQLSGQVANIQDPVIRDATVLGWLEDNAQAISPAQGEAACGLLDDRRAHSCRRRLQSAHLNR